MKKIIYLIVVLVFIFAASFGFCEDDIYYARCNLKVIKGSLVTWVNWQATYEFIPVNTKLKVINERKLVDFKTKREYTLDMGATGEVFLEKFVLKSPVNMKKFSKEAKTHIKDLVAKIGMTKEEVYIAMGPPSWITSGKTYNKTYDDIMASDLWVYKRRRFAKNIGVAFDPVSGQVNRTEGIWGK